MCSNYEVISTVLHCIIYVHCTNLVNVSVAWYILAVICILVYAVQENYEVSWLYREGIVWIVCFSVILFWTWGTAVIFTIHCCANCGLCCSSFVAVCQSFKQTFDCVLCLLIDIINSFSGVSSIPTLALWQIIMCWNSVTVSIFLMSLGG